MMVTPVSPEAPDGTGSQCPSLLPARDLARMLAVSTRTLWRLLDAGKLIQPIRLGGSVRWRREEVEAWIRAGCPEQKPERIPLDEELPPIPVP